MCFRSTMIQRRELLGAVAWPLLGSAGRSFFTAAEPESAAVDILAQWVRANDLTLPGRFEAQESQAGHRWRGGVRDDTGIHTAGGTAGLITAGAAAWVSAASRFTKSPELLDRMRLAASYLVASQHEDGTIDLHTTNFHSPPDTGFVVEPLTAAYALLRTADPSEELKKLLGDLESFLRRAGRALARGGVHTPNHRWVVCAALARLHALFPDPTYQARIQEWLSEGIDIDPDGQFSERSSAIYSPLTDRVLMTIARLMKRPELLEPVRRNLEMTLYYLHADGEVVTGSSLRQDQYTRGSSAGYYLPYRYLAIHDQNGRFAAMARWIEQLAGDRLAGNLAYLLEEPLYQRPLPAPEPLPSNYLRHFSHSSLVRIRRDRVSATLLARNPVFFSFHKGPAALQALRLATAFFGKGQFQPDRLEVEDRAFRLSQSLRGPYYQPLPPEARQPGAPWLGMNQTERPQSEVQQLEYRVEALEKAGSFEITLDISGCERVPVALEFGFRRGGTLSGVTPLTGVPDAFLLTQEQASYTLEGEMIHFGPGPSEHQWTQLRGALPKQDALSVYLTGFTPFRRKIFVR